MDITKFKGKEESVCLDARNMTIEDFTEKYKVKKFEVKPLIEELEKLL